MSTLQLGAPSSVSFGLNPVHSVARRGEKKSSSRVCTRALRNEENGSGDSSDKSSGSFGNLRLFIDSANTEVWKRWLPTGVFHGVTTNPLLLKESSIACQTKTLNVLSNQAVRLGAKEVHLQAWGKTVENLVSTGSELASIDNSIVVQFPATYMGLRSAKKLKDMGARIGLIVYSVHQALLALGIGAEYVAFNVGVTPLSLDDSIENLSNIQSIVRGASSINATRLLVCNVVTVEQLTSLALSRVSSLAVAPATIESLFMDNTTEQMVKEFEAAASKNAFSLFL